MVFCVSCGHKLAGRYCGQCGGDSQSTADAQAEVPVLTVPAGGAKKLLPKDRLRKTSQRLEVGRDASKRKGSAAGGIGVAQASGQVLENLPAAVASRASPPFTQTAAHGGKKSLRQQRTVEEGSKRRKTPSRRRFKTLVSLHSRTDNGNNMWRLHFLPRVHLPRATSCMRCISYRTKIPSVHISLT